MTTWTLLPDMWSQHYWHVEVHLMISAVSLPEHNASPWHSLLASMSVLTTPCLGSPPLHWTLEDTSRPRFHHSVLQRIVAWCRPVNGHLIMNTDLLQLQSCRKMQFQCNSYFSSLIHSVLYTQTYSKQTRCSINCSGCSGILQPLLREKVAITHIWNMQSIINHIPWQLLLAAAQSMLPARGSSNCSIDHCN